MIPASPGMFTQKVSPAGSVTYLDRILNSSSVNSSATSLFYRKFQITIGKYQTISRAQYQIGGNGLRFGELDFVCDLLFVFWSFRISFIETDSEMRCGCDGDLLQRLQGVLAV